jgi:IMP dehydrogenase
VNGTPLGILTNRDVRFVEVSDFDKSVSEYMTPQPLVTAAAGIDLEYAKALLQQYRIEKLPLVDDDGILKGLITVRDIQKARDFPLAAVDTQGRLLVGAAVGVGADLTERLQLMVAEGLDLVVIDTAHGHSERVIHAIHRSKHNWPDLPVMAGNVITAQGADMLIKAGADIVKVGVGAGSICTTRVVSGSGMPQLSAIYNCAETAHKLGKPLSRMVALNSVGISSNRLLLVEMWLW